MLSGTAKFITDVKIYSGHANVSSDNREYEKVDDVKEKPS